MKHKRWRKWLWILAAAVVMVYLVGANFLVSAALVPSTMEKLDAFSRITEDSYEALVQTDDIQQQNAKAWDETRAWAELAHGQKLEKTTEDGYCLIAQEIFTEEESHKWVLLLHGYTGWKEAMYPFAAWYNKRGYHVLVPDMRCHGESEGDFIGMGWTDRLDNMLWIDYILQQDSKAEIVIHGQSMGAASALMMTGEESLPDNVRAVISDCAFTDAYTMFGEKMKEWFHLPKFPLLDTANLMLQLRGGYDLKEASALKAVKKSKTPTLFIHGNQDEMIDVEMTRELYQAASSKEKELLIVKGAGHAQSQDKDPEGYFGAVEKFLNRCHVEAAE